VGCGSCWEIKSAFILGKIANADDFMSASVGLATIIVKGSSCNPSVRKLVALASGLGVDPVELFKVAAGVTGERNTAQSFPAPDAAALLAVMKRIVSNDKLIDIMTEALLLESSGRLAVLRVLRSLNEAGLEQTKTATPG